MSKRDYLFITLIFLSISHVLMPVLNAPDDFFIFKKWNMFSGKVENEVVDISWDNGKTFLFRDFRKEARRAGTDIYALWPVLRSGDLNKVRQQYGQQLMSFCKCNELIVYYQKNKIFDHIIRKVPGETIRTEKL